MAMQFTPATRLAAKLRLAAIGPPGSGKTYTALLLASHLGGRIALIDTERGSASKYAPKPGKTADPAQGTFAFDVLELTSFAPRTYIDALQAAEAAGYDIVIVDSLSHAWVGKGGALEMVDRVTAASKSRNSFDSWRSVTPHHNALVDAMLACKAHLLVTLRSKVEYVLDDGPGGKKTPRKVGMAPIQRDGLEYEFDVVGEMGGDNDFVVTKTRCSPLAGQVFHKPGRDVATILADWLATPEPPAAPAAPPAAAPAPAVSPPAVAPPTDWLARIEAATKAAKPGAALITLGKDLDGAALNGTRGTVLAAYGAALAKFLRGLPDAASLTQGEDALATRLSPTIRDATRDAVAQAVAARRAELTPTAPENGDAPDAPDATPTDVASVTPDGASDVLTAFHQSVAEIELPGEAVGLWIKHRPALAAVTRDDREAAWKALCKRTEEVGGMKNAKVWLKKAIAVEDERRGKPENDQVA